MAERQNHPVQRWHRAHRRDRVRSGDAGLLRLCDFLFAGPKATGDRDVNRRFAGAAYGFIDWMLSHRSACFWIRTLLVAINASAGGKKMRITINVCSDITLRSTFHERRAKWWLQRHWISRGP